MLFSCNSSLCTVIIPTPESVLDLSTTKKHYCLIWLSKTSQPGMKQQDFSDTKYQSFIEQYLFVDLDNKSFQGFKMEDVHFDDTSGKSTES